MRTAQVDEKLRRAHTLYLYEEVQVGVRELALPHVQVEYHALQQHLDNIAQESAAQVSVCDCDVVVWSGCGGCCFV